jgi:DNA-binding CsgD family transcriptional regulator
MKKDNTIEVRQPMPKDTELIWVKELAGGASNEEAAESFGINKNTFAFYIAELRRKYGCRNTTQLVVLFKDKGLI